MKASKAPMKATLKISQAQKDLMDEMRNLRKQPRSSETDGEIDQLRQRIISSRGSGSVPGMGENIYYESYEGKFEDGQKAVIVFEKFGDDKLWTSYLFTWLTAEEGKIYFAYDQDEDDYLYDAYNCGFRSGTFVPDDDGLEWNSLDPIREDLGIDGAKGFFYGNLDLYHPNSVDVLKGQKIYFVDDNDSHEIKNSVTFAESESSTSSIWFYVIIVLLILIILMRR